MNKPRGTRDFLPHETKIWRHVENKIHEISELFCFSEIRTPTFEETSLFLKGVGEKTDIVTKEMYTFLDKSNRSLTLKPEGTTPVVRSLIENSLYKNYPSDNLKNLKFYYITPCFRYERPQNNRFREFHQFGAEMFDTDSPAADAEMVKYALTVLKSLTDIKLNLKINNIGCEVCQKKYTIMLKNYFFKFINELCHDCLNRINKNPLRLLDCKICRKNNENMFNFCPDIIDNLCVDCKTHNENFKEILNFQNIDFTCDKTLVRGLDYYTQTVFEIDAGNYAIAGGGRYNNLVEKFSNSHIKAIGFGVGLERLIELSKNTIKLKENKSIYLINALPKDVNINNKILVLANIFRKNKINSEYCFENKNVKSNLKYASKAEFDYVIVIGNDEINQKKINLKNMNEHVETTFDLDFSNIEETLKDILKHINLNN